MQSSLKDLWLKGKDREFLVKPFFKVLPLALKEPKVPFPFFSALSELLSPPFMQ